MTLYTNVKQLLSIESHSVDYRSKHKKQIPSRERNIIISKSRWPIGILVHIIPILAAVVIIAINLRGYFIGNQFLGVTDSTSQSIALSALQVTAKLLEITVIASLGLLILDVVQHFLLFDEAGLPLALTGIRLSFCNLFFLLSPPFWLGIRAFHSRKAQIFVGFLLLSCGLIATFIGPAAALLLIPAIRSNWLAGSLLYQMPQRQQLLWEPQPQLNASSMLNPICLHPSEDTVNNPRDDYSSCPWRATTTLGLLMDPSLGISGNGNVTNQFGSYNRDLSFFTYDAGQKRPRMWAWSGMHIFDCITSSLFNVWTEALNKPVHMERAYNTLWSTLNQYNRYPFRDQFSAQAKLQGMLAPSARAACLGSVRNFQDLDPYPFPILPLNGIAFQDTNATYMIPTTLIQNTSIIRTFWVKPGSAPEIQGAEPNMEYAMDLPSAFLIAQFPNETTNSSTSGLVVTCSIDARWINATQITSLQQQGGIYLPETYSDFDEGTFDSQGRPLTDKLSPRITFDSSWLEQLTPTFNQTTPGTNLTQVSPGYTSLSKALDPLLESNNGMDDTLYRFENIISLLTVDAIARHNFNGCKETFASLELVDSHNPLANKNSTEFDPTLLLASGGQPASLQQDPSKLERSEFLWIGTISGYAYAIDATAYILAAIVLFSYIVFAICHICFTVYKRWYSEIWWSIPDIIALAHHSPPSAFLEHTSGGTDLSSSSKLLMRLRIPDEIDGNDETIHLLVNSHRQSVGGSKIKGYHKLSKGKKY